MCALNLVELDDRFKNLIVLLIRLRNFNISIEIKLLWTALCFVAVTNCYFDM